MATPSTAPRFQGHCSLRLPAARTVKRSCLIYEVGQPKGAKGKERGQPGVGSLLVPSGLLILSLCGKPRATSQKILLERHQVGTERRSETRGPHFLLDGPKFTFRASHSDGGFQNSVYHQTRSDSKNNSEEIVSTVCL